VVTDLLSAVLDAIASATDPQLLREELSKRLPPVHVPVAVTASHTSDEVLKLVVLSDILDDEILSARPSDKAFPLRMLFGDLAEALSSGGPEAESAFALASGLNFYFRAAQPEEARIAVGITASRLYYSFMLVRKKEAREVTATSPLLAALLTSELERARLECVDHQRTFDGQIHDREPGSSTSPQIQAPLSFLCRVATTGVVRSRALVRT
jgi:hypothetical protein